jgi:hypothetical protein
VNRCGQRLVFDTDTDTHFNADDQYNLQINAIVVMMLRTATGGRGIGCEVERAIRTAPIITESIRIKIDPSVGFRYEGPSR